MNRGNICPKKHLSIGYRSETNSTKYNERVPVFVVETRAPATVVQELESACHAIFTDSAFREQRRADNGSGL